MDGMQLPAAAALTARYGAGVEPKIGPWNDKIGRASCRERVSTIV